MTASGRLCRVIDPLLIAALQQDEGFRRRPYICPAGKVTVGYGWNLEAHPVDYDTLLAWMKSGIPAAVAGQNMREHVQDTLNWLADTYTWFPDLNSVRRAVVANMVFNLGRTGFTKFRDTIAAIERGDYADAADEMMASRWARQVGARADRLSRQMRTGSWM